MKKTFLVCLMALSFAACSEDLTDYYTRIENREKANEALKKE